MSDKKFNLDSAKKLSRAFQDIEKGSRLGTQKNLELAMSEVIGIESKMKKGLFKLMKQEDFVKFEAALKISEKAVESKNISLFVESQEELMFSTKPLFLQKMVR
jgi:hypothetical protein